MLLFKEIYRFPILCKLTELIEHRYCSLGITLYIAAAILDPSNLLSLFVLHADVTADYTPFENLFTFQLQFFALRSVG